MKRNRRAGVEDRWTKTVRDAEGNAQTVPSANDGKGKRWRARYVDDQGREHARAFGRKSDATAWLDKQTSAIVTGTHVAPRDAQLAIEQWCGTWLAGYAVHRDTSVALARAHIRQIVAEFGQLPLSALRPSQVKAWTAKLAAEGLAPSYVHALHRRLSQICSDAVHDGLLGRNPCSRRTSPPMAKQKAYVATTEQIWALYDAVPDHLRVAVLLGAFAGLRVGEAAGLRVCDVDFIRGIVHPVAQSGGQPLKTEGSSAPIPIPRDLSLLLSASVQTYSTEWMVTNGCGRACSRVAIMRAIAAARSKVAGLPEGFSYHDLRHYLASLLIASGADIKTVQARLRHATASTTLDIYGHLWPDADESTRTVIGAVIRDRLAATADALRTNGRIL
jgi:integrase